MPVNIKVIRPKDFIKTTVTDLLNFEVSKQTLLDIAAQIEQPGQYEVLLDTREAETVLSVVDIFELGQALADHPFSPPKQDCRAYINESYGAGKISRNRNCEPRGPRPGVYRF